MIKREIHALSLETKTIDEFNSEIIAAFDELKNKEANRQKVYDMINEGNMLKLRDLRAFLPSCKEIIENYNFDRFIQDSLV